MNLDNAEAQGLPLRKKLNVNKHLIRNILGIFNKLCARVAISPVHFH
jgi:hypothetical protein